MEVIDTRLRIKWVQSHWNPSSAQHVAPHGALEAPPFSRCGLSAHLTRHAVRVQSQLVQCVGLQKY